MANDAYDNTVADVQSTPVESVAAGDFDLDRHAGYEAGLLDRCLEFWQADSGVLVYRRMRADGVFTYACGDMKRSLELQLGSLQKGMEYEADVPNFLEPWYGIGTLAAAFGAEYIWAQGQAPAVKPQFASVGEALEFDAVPVAQTPIGRHTLEMIDYFIEQTDGKLPLSFTDTQSPLNAGCGIVDMSAFFMGMLDEPDKTKEFLMRLAGLLVDFGREQLKHIGERAVWPGHGFASCRCFDGLGMSDDDVLMISGQQYLDFVAPAVEFVGSRFGGPVFHSCGDWSSKVEMAKQIKGLRMVDAAFSSQTDPNPNEPEAFADAFAGTGIVVNARIVGGPDTVVDTVKRLWREGMKLIVVTYCQSPDEQAQAYERIHEVCV